MRLLDRQLIEIECRKNEYISALLHEAEKAPVI